MDEDSEYVKSEDTIRTITQSQLEDPLAFDMSKVLVFKMPEVKSKKFKLDCDDANPPTSFKDSQYYRQKHHLKGLLSKKDLKQLHKAIKDLGEHNRSKYDLSPDPAIRKKQVMELVTSMNDAVEASRLEALILNSPGQGQAGAVNKRSLRNKSKIKPKDEMRLLNLLDDRR